VPATERDVTPDIRCALVEYGYPLIPESYLNINSVDKGDLDAEQESELPQLFQESIIEERGAS
jgi:hypothetical protein